MSLTAISREVFESNRPKLMIPHGYLEIWLTNLTLDFRFSYRDYQRQGLSFLNAWRKLSKNEWAHHKVLGNDVYLECNRKLCRNCVNQFSMRLTHDSWMVEIKLLSTRDFFLLGESVVYS